MTARDGLGVGVSGWARREAERRWPDTGFMFRSNNMSVYAEGLTDMAALLLSDEAVEAAARKLSGTALWAGYADEARAALLAAVSAVTATDPNTPISETGEHRG